MSSEDSSGIKAVSGVGFQEAFGTRCPCNHQKLSGRDEEVSLQKEILASRGKDFLNFDLSISVSILKSAKPEGRSGFH